MNKIRRISFFVGSGGTLSVFVYRDGRDFAEHYSRPVSRIGNYRRLTQLVHDAMRAGTAAMYPHRTGCGWVASKRGSL